MSGALRVLLCEPWFTGSHRSWAEGLARHSTHQVTLVTHPGAFWKWRMQGAALTLAEQIEAEVAADGRPDVLLVSDMVHLPALLGLARKSLDGVPVALYLHENQLTYPDPAVPDPAGFDAGDPAGRSGAADRADLTYAMTNWLSMAAADLILFNSAYHRRSWFEALPTFLDRFPDHDHRHRIDEVRARSRVLPVGIEPPAPDQRPATSATSDTSATSPDPPTPPTVLWNHRWEWDKEPDTFVDALIEVAGRGVDFEVILAGERSTTEPDALVRARRTLGGRIIHCGTADPARYRELLARADVVVSTARHEYFGVAVVEAVAAGALPLLPDRLAYPELVPSPDPYLYHDRADLVTRLIRALTDPVNRRSAAERARRHVEQFHWTRVAPVYDTVLRRLAAPAPHPDTAHSPHSPHSP